LAPFDLEVLTLRVPDQASHVMLVAPDTADAVLASKLC
jgi:hypothetical protein